MNLKDYYFDNVKENDYYYRFYDAVKNVNIIHNIFEGDIEANNFEFEIYDPEEAIVKFKELCEPNICFDTEKNCWFYLISFYLNSIGYVIKEFPRLLARPPKDPTDFTYKDIRNRIIANGDDDNGTVRHATRRAFVSELSFELKNTHIDVGDSIEQKFIEISNRNAHFDNMSLDEKIAEIANLIENLLKKDGKFVNLDYSPVCLEYISDEIITSVRKKMQCFRHSSNESILERNSYSEEQKAFLVDYGLIIVKSIHVLVSEDNK